MRPVLIEFLGFSVPSFFFMIMIAALTATFVAVKFAKKEGLSEIAILDMAIIAVIASVIGSRVFHVLVEAPDYYWEEPIRVFYFWQGGFVSLGAFTGTILGWLAYYRYKKLDTLRYLDIGGLVAPIIIFFVRIGCLLTGCCYGKPSNLPFAITFTDPGSTAYHYFPNIPLHPTQIYNMTNAVVMFAVLYFVYTQRKFYGQIASVFLMYYGVSRFFIEFFRGDADRGVYFGGAVSTGQIVMSVAFIAGVIMYVICGRKRIG